MRSSFMYPFNHSAQQRTWLMPMNTAAPLVKPVMTQAF
jgi:hypothetical protein